MGCKRHFSCSSGPSVRTSEGKVEEWNVSCHKATDLARFFLTKDNNSGRIKLFPFKFIYHVMIMTALKLSKNSSIC